MNRFWQFSHSLIEASSASLRRRNRDEAEAKFPLAIDVPKHDSFADRGASFN